MLKMNTYEKWLASMLKAEVVCAELLSGDLTFDGIKYTANGSFKKSFRTDVDAITQTDRGIELIINRDGLYDNMPEGLFHQTRGNSGSSVSEMVAEHKRYKSEEKNARRFFSPFEHEFFRYSLMVEEEERKLTGSLYDEKMQTLLRELWDLSEGLPKTPAIILTRILPWASTIKGDLTLTAKTLELILDKPVEQEEIVTQQVLVSDNKLSLGENSLGMDTLSGSSVEMPIVLWKFKINDISHKEIANYRNDKPFGLLLKKFEDYFIPLEVDAVFEFELNNNIGTEEVTELMLGYSLTI